MQFNQTKCSFRAFKKHFIKGYLKNLTCYMLTFQIRTHLTVLTLHYAFMFNPKIINFKVSSLKKKISSLLFALYSTQFAFSSTAFSVFICINITCTSFFYFLFTILMKLWKYWFHARKIQIFLLKFWTN
jgi:hypothetical protein